MIIAYTRRGTPRGRLYLRLLPSSPREVKGGRVARTLLYARAMPKLCATVPVPRSPVVPSPPSSGQRSAHPLPSWSRLRDRASRLLLSISRDLLSRVVLSLCEHPCPTRSRRRRRVSVVRRRRDASLRYVGRSSPRQQANRI